MDTILGDEADTGCMWAPEHCLVFGHDVIDARDGEADKIDCGPGQDRLVADAVDVHSGCETVEAVEAAVASGIGGQGSDGDGSGGPATGRAQLAPVKTTLARALRGGVRVKVSGAPAGGALKLRARRAGSVIASGSAKVGAGGKATVRLRFTRRARRQLRNARSVRLTVSGSGVQAVKLTLAR